MLLNLGLPADAAAAHPNEPIKPETQPSASTQLCSPIFPLSALPLLNTFYNRHKLPDGSTECPGLVSAMAMTSIESASESGEASTTIVARPQAVRASTARKSRPKTSYQFAHPASHARHKRFKIRPKLLIQLQQVSQTPRPLPVVDVLPSTSYIPLIARKFPAIYRTRNGLGPYDLIVVISDQYERPGDRIPERQVSSEDEDEDHREVVATICQKSQEDARLKGKAEICLNFGPVWDASPLSTGSYEFVAQTDSGMQVVRWALRSGRSRRMTAPSGTSSREDGKRFTFSVIDPTTRRHPVLASMTRNKLEVNDEYSTAVRGGTGPATPSSGMSVVSDASDGETPFGATSVTLDDGLRTLIITTGIWVAFREGWSDNFRYNNLVSTGAKSNASSPTCVKNQIDSFPASDEASPVKDQANGGKRCMSITNICRSNTTAPADAVRLGDMSKRSNSTGAAFMDRAKRRSASGLSTRLNRHSVFTAMGENGRGIVVSRPPSTRRNSLEEEDAPRASAPETKYTEPNPDHPRAQPKAEPDRDVPATTSRITQHMSLRRKKPNPQDSHPEAPTKKGKLRHRLSSMFGMLHRKPDPH
ncbi:hypothetical protein N7535_006677 [Penicillium sp. DV-2018c]|nr:hypothetical protein N7461_007240 [Penicillium sp. DV-2018c]KAJ5567371.1 hypothetical protein N7535_006677 [Penicillium sp. DV-2018c]